MSKVIVPQGKTTNKVIITFKDYSPLSFGTIRESFRCNSIEDAERAISKRDKRRIFFYGFFDALGNKERTELNTKDTILSL